MLLALAQALSSRLQAKSCLERIESEQTLACAARQEALCQPRNCHFAPIPHLSGFRLLQFEHCLHLTRQIYLLYPRPLLWYFHCPLISGLCMGKLLWDSYVQPEYKYNSLFHRVFMKHSKYLSKSKGLNMELDAYGSIQQAGSCVTPLHIECCDWLLLHLHSMMIHIFMGPL